jgi:hypothetical protein
MKLTLPITLSALFLVACGTPPYKQHCLSISGYWDRVACMNQADQDRNAQLYRNNLQPQAPAYDPFRAPTIVDTGNSGLTNGNRGMNCTPDGHGGYNCR